MITKVTTHISPNEQLIFERSQPGRAGFSLPPLDVDETPLEEIIPRELQRDDALAGMPEVSEVDVIRHFTRISTWNYSIDLGMYPLGSCTMKYNSRLNEKVARIAGFANLHPLAAEAEAQGALEVIYELQQHLAEITGLPGISLQPAAGAHGEMTGIMIIRAFIDARDGKEKSAQRRTMLIPDSAHGTNPASAHLSGFTVRTIKSTAEGLTDLDHLRELCAHGDVAGLMLTNPNTLGLFERNIQRDLRHRSRRRRFGLHGRRKHERAGRRRAAGRYGRRCDSPESAQDFFDAARRRRSGFRPLLLHQRTRTVLAGPADID